MTPDQTIQMVTWLDEEHRRDKSTMNQMAAQLDQHLNQITGLTKGLQDLEERIARVQSQSLRYSQIEQALGQVKTEVNLMFDQFEKRAQQREIEGNQVRQLERERLDKAFESLGAKIDEVGQGQRFISGDHEAIHRIEGGQVAFMRGIEELNKRLESFNARLQVTEEWVKRTGALIAEVQALGERLRQDRADALEAMRRADQARSRQVTEWNEQMKVSRREMDDWIAQLRPLLDLPKEVRAYIAQLHDMEGQLKLVEPRLTQRQKLSEEFSRKELQTMKQELEQREGQAVQEWAFMREEWSKKIAAMAQRFDPIDEWRPQVMDEFRELRERNDAQQQKMLNLLADVMRMQIDHDRGNNARYEQHASDLIKRIDSERASAKVKKPPAPIRPVEDNT